MIKYSGLEKTLFVVQLVVVVVSIVVAFIPDMLLYVG